MVSRYLMLLVFTLFAAPVFAGGEFEQVTVAGIDTPDSNRVILDVRTIGEFRRGHIQDAVNIDVSTDSFTDKVALLDRDKTYVVHCAINPEAGRGDSAISVMQSLGFKNVKSLKGGYNAWSTSGRPVTMGNALKE